MPADVKDITDLALQEVKRVTAIFEKPYMVLLVQLNEKYDYTRISVIVESECMSTTDMIKQAAEIMVQKIAQFLLTGNNGTVVTPSYTPEFLKGILDGVIGLEIV